MITTALRLLAARAWAMEPGTVETMLRVARGDRAERLDPEALQSQLGRRLESTRGVTVRDGVAVVPVVGPIFRRANLFTAISGATSTELLARDIRAAVESPEVRTVLLEVDSPGGEAMGIAELAALVAGLRKKKPIHAYADGYCCSGAYWLAAACESIVASPTAILGSIGVVVTMLRGSEDEVEIVSSVSPKKRPDPGTEEGRAAVQEWVDQLAGVFVADVARYRGVPESTVKSDFGQGGVMVGRHAVRAGLADRVGVLEGILPRLAAGNSPKALGAGEVLAMEAGQAEALDWSAGGEEIVSQSSHSELKSAYTQDGGSLEEPGAERSPVAPGSGGAVPPDGDGAGQPDREEHMSEETRGGGGAGVSAETYAQMEERLRQAEARTAALEAAEARRGVTAALAETRFLAGDGNPGYGLAAAARERLTEALMGLDGGPRTQVLEAITGAELVPVGTVGFPTGDGAAADAGGAETLTAADRAIIATEAQRRGLPAAEVEREFLAARAARKSKNGGER